MVPSSRGGSYSFDQGDLNKGYDEIWTVSSDRLASVSCQPPLFQSGPLRESATCAKNMDTHL